MRNIFLLTKNYVLCGMGTMRGKKSKWKSYTGMLLIILIYAAIFAFFLYSQMEMVADLVAVGLGLEKNVLFMGYSMGIFMALIFAVQRVTGGQKANDLELLLSMPVKKSEILIAKAASRYLFNLLLVSLFILPSIIAYLWYTPFVLVALLGNIVTLLVIPLLAVGISYILDFVVSFCFPSSKFGNVIKAGFVLIALIGFVYIYEYVILNVETLNARVLDYILTFNPVFMLGIIGGTLIIFALGIFLFARTITHEAKTTKNRAVNLAGKPMGQFRALLKNEVNRYLNSTVLMINTVLSPIGIVALTIWMLVDKGKIFMTLAPSIGLPAEVGLLFIALAFSSLVILTYPAAFSISLEGKQFWILKSMPVRSSKILLVKSLFNILLITPVVVICSVLLRCVIDMDIMIFLAILLLPILLNIIVSFGGVLINLLFPKFEFESDAAVVKQSMSGFIMSLGGLIAVILLAVLFYKLLTAGISLTLALLLPIIILAVIALAVVILTFTVGKRLFDKL